MTASGIGMASQRSTGPSEAWKASTRGLCMIGARAGIWASRSPQMLTSLWPALHEKRKSTSFARVIDSKSPPIVPK